MINFFQNADGGLTFVNGADDSVIMRLDTDGNIYMADTTLVFTNIDAGASGTAGSVDIFPTTASKGKLAFTATANTNNDTTTITNAAQGGAYTYTIPDAGASAAFVMTAGTQTLSGTYTFSGANTFSGVQSFTLPQVLDHNTTISAFAGGGQASATALTGQYNNVTTVATNFDSVKLLTAVAGQVQTVRNSGAAILSVFPNTSDTINGMAVNLSIDIPVGGEVTFRAIDATDWRTETTVTLPSPSTQAGNLVIKAADNAGNTQTIITNASQAAARTYTIPDAGANASFVMTQGTQTIVGATSFTAAITPTGGVAAAGGFSAAARNIHTGAAPAQVSTDGTDATPVNTETYIVEVFIPCNMTANGVALMNGSAVSGNIKMALANSSGAVVASTASTAQSGTDAYQRVDFSSPYSAVGPATYYVLLQVDNGTARYNAHTFGNFGASKKTGEVYGTFTTITPPTTFTTALGPIASLY